MADEQAGATETLTQTVEPQGNLNQVGLAEILKDTLERDEQPEPQPTDAEEQSEESESPEETPVSAGEDEGNDLSQTETTEAEAEPAAAEVDDEQPDGLPPDIQESVNKRIGKEVRKRKTIEEEKAAEISDLKAQLATAEARVDGAESTEFTPLPTETNPFASLNTVEEVRKEMMQAEQTLEWAEDNPDGSARRQRGRCGDSCPISLDLFRRGIIWSRRHWRRTRGGRTRRAASFRTRCSLCAICPRWPAILTTSLWLGII